MGNLVISLRPNGYVMYLDSWKLICFRLKRLGISSLLHPIWHVILSFSFATVGLRYELQNCFRKNVKKACCRKSPMFFYLYCSFAAH